MKCKTCLSLVDDYIDLQINRELREEIDEHLESCPACRMQFEQAVSLIRDLKSLHHGVSDSKFIHQQVEKIRNTEHRTSYRWLATAASLLIGVFVLFSLSGKPKDTLPSFELVINESRTVNLAFNTPEALSNVTIHLQLPENIQLAGNPGVREFNWEISLPSGENILPLPIIATGATNGTIVAELHYKSEVKRFLIEVRASSAKPVKREQEGDHA